MLNRNNLNGWKYEKDFSNNYDVYINCEFNGGRGNRD